MRHAHLVAALVLAAGLAPARDAAAQAIPNITNAKRVASNAASAANAHTTAMSGGATTPAPSKPAAPAATTPQPSSKGAKPAPTKPATAAKPAERVDSAQGRSTSVAVRGSASELTFSREVFSYGGAGRRDPFMSLFKSGDLRPLLSDLRVVTVLYDPTGRNSVAILRDQSTKDQYRAKVGQQIGRMRVAQIQPKQVVFTINEFGYSRQETLALVADTTKARTR